MNRTSFTGDRTRPPVGAPGVAIDAGGLVCPAGRTLQDFSVSGGCGCGGHAETVGPAGTVS
jgi:hypothetical protein